MASVHFSCLALNRCYYSLDYLETDSRQWYCQHSIAFVVGPIRSCPYLAYDDGFDAVISNAYLHRQNCTDHRVAVVVALVVVAIWIKFYWCILLIFWNAKDSLSIWSTKYVHNSDRTVIWLTSNELGVPGADEIFEFFVDGVVGESNWYGLNGAF